VEAEEQISGKKLVKVNTDKLAMGMYIAKLDRPWLDSPFLFQGFPLERNEDLATLRALCDYVYVDAVKSKSLRRPAKREESLDDILKREKTTYIKAHPVENEIDRAKTDYDVALASVEEILQQAARGETINAKIAKQHVKACVDSVIRNPNALIWLSHIKHVDNHTAEHCLHVGILAIALGRQLGLPRRHLETLGLCGMLHDVGKTRVNLKVLFKQDKLTPEEFEHLKQHPVYGRDLLQHDPMMPPEVIEAAFSHHERIDGQGYPRGIDASMLSFYTRITSIVDAYDGLTSPRMFSEQKSSTAALKILYEQRGKQFDQDLVVKFIECVGLYPPGCIVELSSGEVGVVIASDADNRLHPKVVLVLDGNKRPIKKTMIDLKTLDEAQRKEYHIKQVIRDGTYGVRLEEFTANTDFAPTV
jgi:HD-GYP domain-containing protein (c-di-GMP phosphodiesterase class II)